MKFFDLADKETNALGDQEEDSTSKEDTGSQVEANDLPTAPVTDSENPTELDMFRNILLGPALDQHIAKRLEIGLPEKDELGNRLSGMESFLARELGSQEAKLKEETERLTQENDTLRSSLQEMEERMNQRISKLESDLRQAIKENPSSTPPQLDVVERLASVMAQFGGQIQECVAEATPNPKNPDGSNGNTSSSPDNVPNGFPDFAPKKQPNPFHLK